MTALALAVLVVTVFVAACWWRAYTLIRYDREQRRRIDAWWESRLREEASSLDDDSCAFEAPCGEVVKFPTRGTAA
jgi:hypothetical protein